MSEKRKLTREEMEERRLQARRLQEAGGFTLSRTARRLGVSRTSVSRWRKAYRKGGIEALKMTKASGRPRWLRAQQLEDLRAELLAHQGRRITQREFRDLIEFRYGHRYSPDHAGRIMHELLSDQPKRSLVRPGFVVERVNEEARGIGGNHAV